MLIKEFQRTLNEQVSRMTHFMDNNQGLSPAILAMAHQSMNKIVVVMSEMEVSLGLNNMEFTFIMADLFPSGKDFQICQQ